MAKVNAGFGNASLAQQYSGQPINPLTVGVDPTQYYQGLNDPNDPLARALALDHHPVYSIGQGVADVAGKLGAAYLEKKARQHEIQAQQQAYGALNDASTIAGNDDLARAMIGGQVNNVQGGQAQLPGGGGPSPMNPGMRNAQVSLPANMVGSSDPNAQPLTAQDRYGAAMGQLRQNPNQGLAEAFSGNIQQAAQTAQQPSFTGTLGDHQRAYVNNKMVAEGPNKPETVVIGNNLVDKDTGKPIATMPMNDLQRSEIEKNNAEAKAAAQKANLLTGIPPGVQGDEVFKYTTPLETASVQAIIDGKQPLPSRTANPQGQRIAGLVEIADPTYSTARYKMTQDFGPGGKVGQNLLSANSAIEHLDTMLQKADALGNINTPLVGKAYNAISQSVKSTGANVPLVGFNTAKENAAGEMTKFIRGTSGDAHSVEEWRKNLGNGLTVAPDEAHEAANTAIDLLLGRVNETAAAYNAVARVPKRPEEFLSPKAQQIIARIRGEQPPGDGSTPPAPAAPAPPSDVPPNVDPAIWAHGTPEEKALWQK